MKRRIVNILTALALCLSLLPETARAAGDTGVVIIADNAGRSVALAAGKYYAINQGGKRGLGGGKHQDGPSLGPLSRVRTPEGGNCGKVYILPTGENSTDFTALDAAQKITSSAPLVLLVNSLNPSDQLITLPDHMIWADGGGFNYNDHYIDALSVTAPPPTRPRRAGRSIHLGRRKPPSS